MLTLRLLGAPQITRAEQPLHLPRRKSRALVYYLAAHTQPVTREQLLALLWPDLERPAAQQTLRTTVHGLRKALEADLLIEADTLALGPEVAIDVRELDRRSEGGGRKFENNLQAVNPPLLSSPLSQLTFLSSFSLPDAPTFEEWLFAQRERYQRLLVRELMRLSQQAEAEGNFPAALEAVERALEPDGLQEDLQRDALRLHYLAGDRAGAIRRYENLRQLLDREMGVPPMAETRALYDSILNEKLEGRSQKAEGDRQKATGRRREAAGRRAEDKFVGRARELQLLNEARATGQLALIEGEPGLGKTRLAEEFMRATDAIVLTGLARELEQALPYQPFIAALRGLRQRSDWPQLQVALRAQLSPLWIAEVTRLLPELDLAPPPAQPSIATASLANPTLPPDESRLWESLHQLLLGLAAQHPIIVFLDDLHWADASTLALLGYLLRQRAPAGALFFLGTARPFAARSALATLTQTLTREGRLKRLALDRLTSAELTALIPAQQHHLLAWLSQCSEGNPYILMELVRYARENELERAAEAPVVPQSVYTLIQARLTRLSDAARRLLDAGVAVGREFEAEVAARAGALSESVALDALDELVAAGLIHPNRSDLTGQRYVFDHTLTMEVAYREIGELRHRLLHRRVAEALESLHRGSVEASAGVLASHFMEGNAPERAAPYAVRAGQLAAQLGAWTEAIAFYEQAIHGAPQSATIYIELGTAHLNAGHYAQGTEAFRQATTLADDPAELEQARLWLAQSLLPQARYSEALSEAQHLAQTSPTLTVRASAEAVWGTALSLEGADLASAAEHLQNAVNLLRDESGPVDIDRLAQVTFELGSVKAQQGDLQRAIMFYRESLKLAEASTGLPSAMQQVLAHNNLAYHLHLLGDLQAAVHAEQGLRLAQEKGVVGLQVYLRSTLGEIALAARDLALAEGHFTEGLTLAERIGAPERIAGLTANLGLVAAQRGETALAIHRLSSALARAEALGIRHLAAQIRIWLAPLLPPTEARATLAEARSIAESGGRRLLLEEVAQLERQIGHSEQDR